MNIIIIVCLLRLWIPWNYHLSQIDWYLQDIHLYKKKSTQLGVWLLFPITEISQQICSHAWLDNG